MLTLSSKMTVPPGGWRFTVPQTGTLIAAPTFALLYHEALAVLNRAGVQVGLDYEQEFTDQLCRQLSSDCEVVPAVTNETRTVTSGDVIRFLKVMWAWRGQGTVDQAEADRRAEICAGCRYNVAVTGCSACQGIAGKIAEVIGDRSTRWDRQLRGCAVCACENKAQVHLPLEVLHKGVTPAMDFPAHCWKRIDPAPST